MDRYDDFPCQDEKCQVILVLFLGCNQHDHLGFVAVYFWLSYC